MYVYLPDTVSIILITGILMVSAYIDYHTKEIPLEIVFCGFFLSMTHTILIQNLDVVRAALGLGISLLIFLPLALTKKSGGGDLIVMALLGWCLTANGILYILIFSITVYIVMGLWTIWKEDHKTDKNKKEYNDTKDKPTKKLKARIPFMPAVFIGWGIYLILGLCVS